MSAKARFCRRAVGLLACLLVSSPAMAVVLGRTDTSDFSNPASNWYGMNWSYVGRNGVGGAVAVDDYWVLTARHLGGSVGGTVSFGGTNYTIAEVKYAPTDSGQTLPPDLMLLRVTQKLSGHYDLYTGNISSMTNKEAIVVGYGYDGVSTDSGTKYSWNTGTATVERWGTNKITGNTRVTGSVSGTPTYNSRCLEMEFTLGNTEYEAGLADRDSGGGIFVKVSDGDGGYKWVLAGINAYVDNQLTGVDKNWAVAIPSYYNWITTTIPEPATFSVLLGGVALLAARRRRRKAA